MSIKKLKISSELNSPFAHINDIVEIAKTVNELIDAHNEHVDMLDKIERDLDRA